MWKTDRFLILETADKSHLGLILSDFFLILLAMKTEKRITYAGYLTRYSALEQSLRRMRYVFLCRICISRYFPYNPIVDP